MIEPFLDRFLYMLVAVLLGVGLYMAISAPNLLRKLIGVNLLQTAVFLLFITMAYVDGGAAPVLSGYAGEGVHASPLPQVIVLTAIVVGVAVTALGLALIVRLHAQYGSIEEDVIEEVRRND